MAARLDSFPICLFLCFTSCRAATVPAQNFAAERERMVQQQIIMRGIADERVLAAMGKVPREEFVPIAVRNLTYQDQPLPIGEEQTISQPFIVAFMSDKLEIKPGDRVLEIGTGSGYQAAILAEMGAKVYTIEIIESLGKRAAATLQRLGYKGWPEHAPFDAVIVTCAPEKVPQPLVEQTKEGGRIVIPVGAPNDQKLYVLEKKAGRLERRAILPVRFVPMTGTAERVPQ